MTEERKADHHSNIESQPVDSRPQQSKTGKPSFWTRTNIIGLGLGVLNGATSGAVVAFLSILIISTINFTPVEPGDEGWIMLSIIILIIIGTPIGAIIGVYGGLFGAFIALWVVSKFLFNNVLKWLLIYFGACVGGTLAALVGLGVWLVYIYV